MKIGDRVAMYGAGAGSNTFWEGDKGIVVGFDELLLVVMPLDFPNERHSMHPKQLRRLKPKTSKKLNKPGVSRGAGMGGSGGSILCRYGYED